MRLYVCANEKKIFELFQKYRDLYPAEIQELLPLSRVTIHKHLKELVKKNKIEKWGRTPWCIYMLTSQRKKTEAPSKAQTEELISILD